MKWSKVVAEPAALGIMMRFPRRQFLHLAGAPKATPAEVVGTLNDAVGPGLADSNLQPKFVALGVEPRPMTPAEFKGSIAAEIDKWAKVIEFAGIKPE